MKTIEGLTNVEKAKLLYQLFPGEIAGFVQFVDGMCSNIREHEQASRSKWDNGFITFDYWLQLVSEVQGKISKYGARLSKNQRLFADQLFDGLLAVYTNHCLNCYITAKQQPNKKFGSAIDLLFNP
jgi:hypothetical protein